MMRKIPGVITLKPEKGLREPQEGVSFKLHSVETQIKGVKRIQTNKILMAKEAKEIMMETRKEKK